MFLVVDQLTVGVLFLVYLFLLRPRQVPAIGFHVGMLLLLDSAVVGAELLRFLPSELAVLKALVDTLALIINPRIDLVAPRMFFRKVAAGRVPVACLGAHRPSARCQCPCQKIAHCPNHLSLPNGHNVPLLARNTFKLRLESALAIHLLFSLWWGLSFGLATEL